MQALTFPAGSSTLPLSNVLIIDGFVNNSIVSASLCTFLFASASSSPPTSSVSSSVSTSEPPSSSSTAPSSVSSPSTSSSCALAKMPLPPLPVQIRLGT